MRSSEDNKHIIAMYTDTSKANKGHSKRKIFSVLITKKAIPITDLEVAGGT
jgi:hypothetical protein